MNRMADFQTIIVDLDGTLYFQKPVRLMMLLEMLSHFWYFRDFFVIYKYRKLYEDGYDEAHRLLLLPNGAQHIIYIWMIEKPLRHVVKYRDKKLVELLEQSMREGKKVIVYSDYPVKEKLDALGFLPTASFSSDDVKCMKPKADGILTVLTEMQIETSSCLVLGDRYEKDGKLAENLGAKYHILPASRRKREHLYRTIGYL